MLLLPTTHPPKYLRKILLLLRSRRLSTSIRRRTGLRVPLLLLLPIPPTIGCSLLLLLRPLRLLLLLALVERRVHIRTCWRRLSLLVVLAVVALLLWWRCTSRRCVAVLELSLIHI